ncbi:thioesterase II family protein [Pseudoalteromonas prydzensis]|uniref:Thioesterase n=1 Tax=Pseudoalteromonas prydzensis TaxID=182141 RepID=A0ABR9FJR1_9GAMM|nr:alpha/beta fold hydrolase [Pseudoalteromonas prydzensis]MBE0457049.1 thioesterase [Pseudoalteromonas prydzensis]
MSETRIKLLCLPCAGASAAMYLRWCRFLPTWIELIPIELAGRGPRLGERAVTRYEQQIAAIINEYSDEMTGNFAFFGHSMGALLANGVTQALQNSEASLPQVLLLSACPAPESFVTRNFPEPANRSALIASLHEQGGTPVALFSNPQLLEMTLAILASDYQVLRSFHYQSQPSLTMPLHLLFGQHDDVSNAQLSDWQKHSQHKCHYHGFAGGHFFIQSEQAKVLALITELLSRYVVLTT